MLRQYHPGAFLKPLVQRFFAYKVFFRRTCQRKNKKCGVNAAKIIFGVYQQTDPRPLKGLGYFLIFIIDQTQTAVAFATAVWFACILFFMAGARHRTVGTIAAAGGFTLFLISHKAHYNSSHNGDKHKAYNYGSNICF